MQIAIISVPNFGNKEDIANGSLASALIVKAFKEATFIPTNATNGDVIKTMFPNAYIEETTNDGIVFIDNGGGVTHFNRDWWNAKFKTESEAKE